jgi:hypothetical protein
MFSKLLVSRLKRHLKSSGIDVSLLEVMTSQRDKPLNQIPEDVRQRVFNMLGLDEADAKLGSELMQEFGNQKVRQLLEQPDIEKRVVGLIKEGLAASGMDVENLDGLSLTDGRAALETMFAQVAERMLE